MVSPKMTFVLSFFLSTLKPFFDSKLFSGRKKERQLLLIQATRLEKNRRLEMTRLLIICRRGVGFKRAQGHVSASFVQLDSESAPETRTIHGRPQGSYWDLLSSWRSLSALSHAITLHFGLNYWKDVTEACRGGEAILSAQYLFLRPWRDFSI